MSRSNRRAKPAEIELVVGYLRCSTVEQLDSGLGLSAQRRAIEDEANRRGWTIVQWNEDALSGKSLVRPGLLAALEAVDTGKAGTLMVAKLDRLSRSLADFAALMARAQHRRWNLVAIDMAVDLSTPAGEFMASVMAAAAQWERRIIGARTKAALAEKKASGVKLGRSTIVEPELATRIKTLHANGAGWSAIAAVLNAEGTPTVSGGAKWYPSTIRAITLANQPKTK
jgi:DNA invertase Pin-like site-specific DNA recombinase